MKKLFIPDPDSYKGKNGRLLIIAGSKKYHGAAVMSAAMAAKIVDFLYIYTTKSNFDLIKKTREKLAEFIYINDADLDRTTKEADAILVGPGLLPDKKTANLVKKILKNHPDKKILLDAGALRVLNHTELTQNCIITPHKQEFKALFGTDPTVEEAAKISLTCPAVIILKGSIDYVIQDGKIFYNNNGNVGMTKGGTGDVLAGLLSALLTKNDPLTASKQAVFANGKAGDRLYKKYKHFYSATELIPAVQTILATKK